jgi:predicted  nucleic acid-binding Zn-ribbon protein
MSMRLKQEGPAGFDRILGLLNELIEDAKHQIHEINKTHKAVSARCEVTTQRLRDQDGFMGTRLHDLTSHVELLTKDHESAQHTVSFLEESRTFFTTFLENERRRHQEELAFWSARAETVAAAIEETDNVIRMVNEWGTLQGPDNLDAVDAGIENLTDAYLQIKNYKIIVPQSFVQVAADDETTRQRLLEWLSEIRLVFLDAQQTVDTTVTLRQNANWFPIENEVTQLLESYEADLEGLTNGIARYEENIATSEASLEEFQALFEENKGLIQANEDYCRFEETSFADADADLQEQLRLFKDVREYFMTHYTEINNFVKERYH